MIIQQMVNPHSLVEALDTSCDLGYISNEDDFLDWKLSECDRSFITSIKRHGVMVPVVVVINDSGYWKMGNGHHRVAAALHLDIDEIPVMFCSGDDFDTMHKDSSSDKYVCSDGSRSRW